MADYCPLSYTQQGLFVMHQAGETVCFYNISDAALLAGILATCPRLLFRGRKARHTAQDYSANWQPFCEQFIKLSVVQANHYSMLKMPGSAQVAIVVDDVLGGGSG